MVLASLLPRPPAGRRAGRLHQVAVEAGGVRLGDVRLRAVAGERHQEAAAPLRCARTRAAPARSRSCRAGRCRARPPGREVVQQRQRHAGVVGDLHFVAGELQQGRGGVGGVLVVVDHQHAAVGRRRRGGCGDPPAPAGAPAAGARSEAAALAFAGAFAGRARCRRASPPGCARSPGPGRGRRASGRRPAAPGRTGRTRAPAPRRMPKPSSATVISALPSALLQPQRDAPWGR
jgi:hypothetical protein